MKLKYKSSYVWLIFYFCDPIPISKVTNTIPQLKHYEQGVVDPKYKLFRMVQ